MPRTLLDGLMLILAAIALVLLYLAIRPASLSASATDRPKTSRLAREGLGILAYLGLILFYASRDQTRDALFWGTLSIAAIAFIGESVNALQRLRGIHETAGKLFLAAGLFSVVVMVIRLW